MGLLNSMRRHWPISCADIEEFMSQPKIVFPPLSSGDLCLVSRAKGTMGAAFLDALSAARMAELQQSSRSATRSLRPTNWEPTAIVDHRVTIGT